MAIGRTAYGVSEEAKYAEAEVRKGRRELLESSVLGMEFVRDELGTVWEECREPDWDGYDALSIDQETLRNAYLFLEALPLGTIPPSVGAEPDGALTLEWHKSRRRTLSVSVSSDGELHYAALLGPNRVFGTEFFAGDVPSRLLTLIDEVCWHA